MGGFTINGCGAADSFKKMKDLGTKWCGACSRQTETYLCQVNRKIRVFYIPTLTLKSSYGVVCWRCKQGYYVSEEDAGRLLAGAVKTQVESVEETKTCPACQNACGVNEKFCGKCGQKMEVE